MKLKRKLFFSTILILIIIFQTTPSGSAWIPQWGIPFTLTVFGRVTDGHTHVLEDAEVWAFEVVQLKPKLKLSLLAGTSTDEAGVYEMELPNIILGDIIIIVAFLRDILTPVRYRFAVTDNRGSTRDDALHIPKAERVTGKILRVDIDFRADRPRTNINIITGRPFEVNAFNNMHEAALVYYYSHIAMRFFEEKLRETIDFDPGHKGVPVILRVFSNQPTEYDPRTGIIELNSADSSRRPNDHPDNREWHELCHHLMNEGYGTMPPRGPGNVPHGGFRNSNTADSYAEGFAIAFSMFIKEFALAKRYDVPGRVPLYRTQNSVENLEINRRIHTRPPPAYEGSYLDPAGNVVRIRIFDHRNGHNTNEEFAVAGILWDLHDNTPPIPILIPLPMVRMAIVIPDTMRRAGIIPGIPPLPLLRPLEVHDHMSMGVRDIWNMISGIRPRNLKELYDTFNQLGPPHKRNFHPGVPLSSLDEIFIAHGAFSDSVIRDFIWEPGEAIGETGQRATANRREYFWVDRPPIGNGNGQYWNDNPPIGNGDGFAQQNEIEWNELTPLGARNRRNVPPTPGSYILAELVGPDGGSVDEGCLEVMIEFAPPHEDYTHSYTAEVKNGLVYLAMPSPMYMVKMKITAMALGYPNSSRLVIDTADAYALMMNATEGYFLKHTFKLTPGPKLTLKAERSSLRVPTGNSFTVDFTIENVGEIGVDEVLIGWESINFSGVHERNVSVDAGGLVDVSFDILAPENQTGFFYITFEAYSGEDLHDSVSIEVQVVDETPPQIELISPSEGGEFTVGEVVKVEWETRDNIRVKWVELILDGQSIGNFTEKSYNLTDLSEGSHIVKAVVLDDAGNEATDIVDITIIPRPLLVVKEVSEGPSWLIILSIFIAIIGALAVISTYLLLRKKRKSKKEETLDSK